MGYSVLYIAFGIVALWLLGEVLLQYKARLRWRVLAFAGFLGLVIGVADRSVVLIVLGALAFGTGQSQVTLSYKRGFSTGWAIGGRPGSSRRRRAAGARPAEPVLEVGPIEADQAAGPDAAQQPLPTEELAGVGANATAVHDFSVPSGDPQGQGGYGAEQAVYQPMPMQDDSGEYPLYDGQSTYTPDPYTSGGYEGYGAQGYQSWTGYEQQQPAWDQGQGQQQGQDQDGGGYQEQPAPAAASYGYDPDDYDVFGNARGTDGGGYGGEGAGDWQSPQPYPQQPAADTYGGYGFDQQAYDQQAYGRQQPYIPQQQHQPPYEQQQQPEQQQEYADPYDPYRY
ncbi:hypothetical protein OG896_30265 [Streptomyces sp. NBC_00669]|uniref:hypothetical protein n=1 Tax=unclassified Streptomyces TaxID=2593676 RepID=UPI002E32C765|nr:hypothetical protein [Streptomyces sp. NBC_00669]